jgi:hypothetical protein
MGVERRGGRLFVAEEIAEDRQADARGGTGWLGFEAGGAQGAVGSS